MGAMEGWLLSGALLLIVMTLTLRKR
jgi:hypothetical protein